MTQSTPAPSLSLFFIPPPLTTDVDEYSVPLPPPAWLGQESGHGGGVIGTENHQRGGGDGGGGAGLAARSGSWIWLLNTKEDGMQRVNPFGGLSSANKGTGLQTKVEGGGAKGEG